MRFEHDGCRDCLFELQEASKLPCTECKQNFMYPQSETKPDLYVPMHKNDAVNHPAHYTQGGIECIDAMKSAFGADELAMYCKIAAFKYIWRCKLKNGSEDVKKAIWYLNKYLELLEGDNYE